MVLYRTEVLRLPRGTAAIGMRGALFYVRKFGCPSIRQPGDQRGTHRPDALCRHCHAHLQEGE